MKEMWDKRYASEEYVYGTMPNRFFKETLDGLSNTGQILLPAEGEGRNAVYAAKKGFSVFAFDISVQAMLKATKLAKQENVTIQYKVGEITNIDLQPASFDVVALIYAHLPSQIRSNFHRQVIELLKPNGIVMLEGFSKRNLEIRLKNPSVGGPDNLALLFSLEEIALDFQELEILTLEEVEINIAEGTLHNGLARVVRFIGRRK